MLLREELGKTFNPMSKKFISSDGTQFNPPNDIDRHCCWLFEACKMGRTNEETMNFVLTLRDACDAAAKQCFEESPDKPINAIPYLSGWLARMVNVNHGN